VTCRHMLTQLPFRLVGIGITIASAAGAQTRAADSAPAGPKLWLNYDFVPGSRVIFFADFLDDQVGNFPKRLSFRNGNMEIVELDGKRYVRITGSSVLAIPLPEILPPKFTIEIDVINRKVLDGAAFRLQGGLAWNNTGKTSTIEWGVDGAGLSQWAGGGGVAGIALNEANKVRYRGKPAQLRILGDGQYIKIYIDEKRYANIPNANFERSKGLTLQAEGRSEENPVYLGQIRVAESGRTIYDQLALKGRVATQGILFDSGSDRIKPESAPTLKEIAAMLTGHPELKLSVEGHTDNVGIAAANLTLSEARAAAVMGALVKDYGIEGARLTAKGLGSSKPASPNSTAEGRQNNRRVELVKV
jgi:OOP family OmpA-OmpF porin